MVVVGPVGDDSQGGESVALGGEILLVVELESGHVEQVRRMTCLSGIAMRTGLLGLSAADTRA